eukprot:GHVP01044337.1.p2 GENE.GHVP01044337.1~~GHVP01044337.1.p2  ORF type:complete len:108 (-),score=15.57 GHVP01044337.1:206-529(-)
MLFDVSMILGVLQNLHTAYTFDGFNREDDTLTTMPFIVTILDITSELSALIAVGVKEVIRMIWKYVMDLSSSSVDENDLAISNADLSNIVIMSVGFLSKAFPKTGSK